MKEINGRIRLTRKDRYYLAFDRSIDEIGHIWPPQQLHGFVRSQQNRVRKVYGGTGKLYAAVLENFIPFLK